MFHRLLEAYAGFTARFADLLLVFGQLTATASLALCVAVSTGFAPFGAVGFAGAVLGLGAALLATAALGLRLRRRTT